MDLLGAVLCLAAVVLVFMVCRKVVNWYTRTNEMVELSKANNELLAEILKEMKANRKED